MKIGLTGNIATGKSLCYEIMTQHEKVVGFDADAEVQRLYKEPHVIEELVLALGDGILNVQGELERSRIRELFLRKPEVKKLLEDIFHPKVQASYEANVCSLDKGKVLLADIPLLYETNRYHFDKVIVVGCSSQTQLLRLQKRSGFDKTTARDLACKQMCLYEKMHYADVVLWNEGNKDQLRRQIETLCNHLFLDE